MSTKKRSKSGTNCVGLYATKIGKCYSIQMTLSTDGLNMSLNCIMTREGTHHMSPNQNGCTIMKSEIEIVIKEMKCGKASGKDDSATQMINALDDEGIKKITELCNLVYDTGYLPPDTRSSIFMRLPKKAKDT